jgi:hypothetical protein
LSWLLLLELISGARETLLAAPAVSRSARNNFETGNYGEAIRILTADHSKGSSLQSEASQMNDRAGERTSNCSVRQNLRSGKPVIARDIFSQLVNSSKDPAKPDDLAARSCLSLDLIDGGAGTPETRAPDIPVSEHLRRAGIYQFNRNFQRASFTTMQL